MSKSKSCVFCGCSDCKISNEDVWPTWVGNLFPAGQTAVSGFRGTDGQLGDIQFVARDNTLGLKVNDVCRAACNAGWMERLESSIRPIWAPSIRDGVPTVLTPEQQRLTARWVLKTVMVLEFTGTGRPFYSFDERNALRIGTLPQPWTTMWLARYSGRYMSKSFAARIGYDVELPNGSIAPVSAHCSVVILGQLAFQILTIRPLDGIRGLEFPCLDIWANRTTTLWPSSGTSMDWPPSADINEDTFDDFMRRFTHNPSAT